MCFRQLRLLERNRCEELHRCSRSRRWSGSLVVPNLVGRHAIHHRRPTSCTGPPSSSHRSFRCQWSNHPTLGAQALPSARTQNYRSWWHPRYDGHPTSRGPTTRCDLLESTGLLLGLRRHHCSAGWRRRQLRAPVRSQPWSVQLKQTTGLRYQCQLVWTS